MELEKYIEKNLREIEDLSDRKAMREVMKKILVPFQNTVLEKYFSLEKRVLEEEEAGRQDYEIVMGIVPCNQYDVTEKKMRPIISEDLKETKVSFEQVKRALETKEELYLFRVFIRADYDVIKKIECERKKFKGIIKTEDGEYSALFVLKKSNVYQERLKELYQTFIHSGVKWNTPCSVYLNKMFEVYLMEGDLVEGEKIQEITIDFDEFEKYINYDYVPIWNIEKIQEKTSYFPIPCDDVKLYEHKIFGEKLGNCDCLVQGNSEEVVNVLKRQGDFIVVSDKSEITEWNLIRFLNDEPYNYEENLFTNKSKTGNSRAICTMAELRKFVKDLGYEKYVTLLDIEKAEKKAIDTYFMDEFIKDELVFMEDTVSLVLMFKAKEKDNYLNKDIISYIVTRVQWEYPQYKCVGKFV